MMPKHMPSPSLDHIHRRRPGPWCLRACLSDQPARSARPGIRDPLSGACVMSQAGIGDGIDERIDALLEFADAVQQHRRTQRDAQQQLRDVIMRR